MLKQQGVSVSLAFVEGSNLATQASVFAGADILVVPHGAATGNLYFLPRHAVIIQVCRGRQRALTKRGRDSPFVLWCTMVCLKDSEDERK